MHWIASKQNTIKLALSYCALLLAAPAFPDEDTATQQLRVIIPKVALIDVSNSDTPFVISFDPITEAGNNFSTATATSTYDVTSNIGALRLYAKTDIDLQSTYNLKLEVNEVGSSFLELTTTAQRVSTQGRQAQKSQPLEYKASPAVSNETIPYGDIDVTVTYTLVEP